MRLCKFYSMLSGGDTNVTDFLSVKIVIFKHKLVLHIFMVEQPNTREIGQKEIINAIREI